MREHFTFTRRPTVMNVNNNKCWWGHREVRTLKYCSWEHTVVPLLSETVWWYLKKLNIQLPQNPAVTVLENCIYTKICRMQMCLILFFIITKQWKQPKWVSEQSLVCPYNGMFFIHKKVNYMLQWRNEVYA
jgi:hypothetical protein